MASSTAAKLKKSEVNEEEKLISSTDGIELLEAKAMAYSKAANNKQGDPSSSAKQIELLEAKAMACSKAANNKQGDPSSSAKQGFLTCFSKVNVAATPPPIESNVTPVTGSSPSSRTDCKKETGFNFRIGSKQIPKLPAIPKKLLDVFEGDNEKKVADEKILLREIETTCKGVYFHGETILLRRRHSWDGGFKVKGLKKEEWDLDAYIVMPKTEEEEGPYGLNVRK